VALNAHILLCRDVQTITVQEMPERAPPGQLPRSVEVRNLQISLVTQPNLTLRRSQVLVENDLVDMVKPGDRVSVSGIFKALPMMGTGVQARGIFKTALLANNVQLLSKDIQGPAISPEDIENIKEMAQREDAFEVLSQSLAPSIYGHKFIKKAILLQMLGGNEKNLQSSGIHLRGDISTHFLGFVCMLERPETDFCLFS
jgi:DNA replication licensing factor MCM3